MLEEKLCMGVEDFGVKFGVSRRVAYELVQREDFPKIRIGRRILIPVAGLEEWIKQQTSTYPTDRDAG